MNNRGQPKIQKKYGEHIMYVWITMCGITFLFVSTALGAAMVFCLKSDVSNKINALFLGFAAGIMIAASVWSLIMPALEEAENGWGRYAFMPIVIGILLGALFFFVVDKGIISPQRKSGKSCQQAPLKNSFKLFFAITLHNIPEGLAVGFAFGLAWKLKTEAYFSAALTLALCIGIQNIPEGAAISLPMRSALHSKVKAFLYGAASGLTEAVFACVGLILSSILRSLQPWLLAFSAGTMLFVVVEDLIPSANSITIQESENSQEKTGYTHAAWGMVIGFVLMLMLDVVFA